MNEKTSASPLQEGRLPSTLAAFLEAGHNVWLQSAPETGHLSLFNRKGVFVDLEAVAVERKHLLHLLGLARTRELLFRIGMEQGRRDAVRHFNLMNNETPLAINASIVFGQLKGLYEGRLMESSVDLAAKTLSREVTLYRNYEALAHRMFEDHAETCVCWCTAGYLSGHLGELTGRRVLTLEVECVAQGAEACRFRSRLDHQWGEEVDWARNSLVPRSISTELEEHAAKRLAAESEAQEALEIASAMRRQFVKPIHFSDLAANDESMRYAVHKAERAAQTDLPVLLTGPRGTGKETMARCMHRASPRRGAPFLLFDCQHTQRDNAARELFGYSAGAFPGAARDHTGILSRAHLGVVYVENVDSLPLGAQGFLVRFLKEGVYHPLGDVEPQTADVRVMASLRQDPGKAVLRHELLEDLYSLFSVATIEVPPLNRRDLDILLLLERFASELRERHDRLRAHFSEEAKRALLDYPWPGNVTQLKSALEYAILFAPEDEIRLRDLPDEVLAVPPGGALGKLTPEIVRAALRQAGGHRGEAADILDVSRTTLWRAMRQMGIG